MCSELPAEPGESMPVAFLLGGRQGWRIWEDAAWQEADGWSAGVVTPADDPMPSTEEEGDLGMCSELPSELGLAWTGASPPARRGVGCGDSTGAAGWAGWTARSVAAGRGWPLPRSARAKGSLPEQVPSLQQGLPVASMALEHKKARKAASVPVLGKSPADEGK